MDHLVFFMGQWGRGGGGVAMPLVLGFLAQKFNLNWQYHMVNVLWGVGVMPMSFLHDVHLKPVMTYQVYQV